MTPLQIVLVFLYLGAIGLSLTVGYRVIRRWAQPGEAVTPTPTPKRQAGSTDDRKEGPKTCSTCGLVSPPGALFCDCGFVFADGTQATSEVSDAEARPHDAESNRSHTRTGEYYLPVLFALLSLSALVASWVVAEYVNPIELANYMGNFDLPWDPTRTGRRYLYLSGVLFGIGAFWIPISRRLERQGSSSWAPRVPASAAILCATALLTGIWGYEMRAPSWTTTFWSLRPDDDLEALHADPHVFFSEASPDRVLRIRSTEGMVSMVRGLGNIGYSGADDLGNAIADEGKGRSATGFWLMFISIGATLGAVAMTTVSASRSPSPG